MVDNHNDPSVNRRSILKNVGLIGSSAVSGTALSQTVLGQVGPDQPDDVKRFWGYRHTNHDEVMAGDATPEREPIVGSISHEQWV